MPRAHSRSKRLITNSGIAPSALCLHQPVVLIPNHKRAAQWNWAVLGVQGFRVLGVQGLGPGGHVILKPLLVWGHTQREKQA